MGHIVVYLQRTPKGLHPCTLLGLCLARDYASRRGASLVGIGAGDGSEHDDAVVRQASRYGADQVLFAGPPGLASAQERLRPQHVLAPWTGEGTAALTAAGIAVPEPSWVCGAPPNDEELSPVVAVIAGTLPWIELADTLAYAEYEDDYRDASTTTWRTEADTPKQPKLYYVAPQDLDPDIRAALTARGGEPVAPDYAGRHKSGTLLWLDAGPAGVPDPLADRPPGARVVLLPGPMATVSPSWCRADWVLPGPWAEAVKLLQAEPWQAALA